MLRYILMVFFSGAFTMTLELVASRLVAPALGVSLYTWTSVIGVIFAGMSLGSYTGGLMADKWDAERILGPVLIVAGLVTGIIVPGVPLLTYTLIWITNPLVKVVLPILTLFGLPSFFIGLVSPIVYRICLTRTFRTGSTVGQLAAAGSLGSIAGTYATGFYLIPKFGTKLIVIGVASGLMLMGLLALLWSKRRFSPFLFVLVVCLAASGMAATKYFRDPDITESAYYQIKVRRERLDDGTVLKKLVLDSLVHSAANPERPDELWYEYEKVAAWVIKNLGNQSMRTYFIGGGGYTLPHWVERHYPEAFVEVAEIDPQVTRVALEEFVPESRRIVSHNEDGRTALQNLPESQKHDLIFGDAFSDVSVPYHLTTLEFDKTIKAHLTGQGVYMANVVDFSTGEFLGAFANTLSQVWKHVYVLPGSDVAAYGVPSPHIVLASDVEIPVESWPALGDVFFDITVGRPDPTKRTLTDDHAPVDSLLLPVFAKNINS